ncbi:MAG: hypothetical protein GX046_02830 [Tissierellia bacterium]|nr:hypothetical protein [Tissierellia bacterium]
MEKHREINRLSWRKGILLLVAWLMGIFIKMEPGLFVSLILAFEVIYIRLEAIKKRQPVYLLEAGTFGLLIVGALLGLFIQGAGIYYYWALAFAGISGSLVHKRYRLPLYLFLQSMFFIKLIPEGLSRTLDILLNLVYGLIMMAAALGLGERRRNNG